MTDIHDYENICDYENIDKSPMSVDKSIVFSYIDESIIIKSVGQLNYDCLSTYYWFNDVCIKDKLINMINVGINVKNNIDFIGFSKGYDGIQQFNDCLDKLIIEYYVEKSLRIAIE